jgi:hypothetical protein
MHTGCLLATSDDEIGKLARPFGLWSKSGHTSFSPSTVDPPQPSGSASSGPIFSRNAIHPSSVNRPQKAFLLEIAF